MEDVLGKLVSAHAEFILCACWNEIEAYENGQHKLPDLFIARKRKKMENNSDVYVIMSIVMRIFVLLVVHTVFTETCSSLHALPLLVKKIICTTIYSFQNVTIP